MNWNTLDVIDRNRIQHSKIIEEAKQVLRDKLKKSKINSQKIIAGHFKKESSVSSHSHNDSNNYGLDGMNNNKSIHALAREEIAELEQPKNLRLPRFEKAIENVNRNLANKYKHKFLESPSEKALSSNRLEEDHDDAQTKKLRQAQFELK